MPSRRQLLAGFGSAAAAGLAGCLGDGAGADFSASPDFSPGTDANTDWPMARYDSQNTAYSPDAKAPREGVQERWTFENGMATGNPVVADGTVFLPTGSELVALDAASGDEEWRFSPSDHPWIRSPVVYDGTVYLVGGDEDSVHAVDAATGEEKWSKGGVEFSAGVHLLAGEHVDRPVLYAGGRNGRLVRLDAETGEETWRTDLFGPISAFGYRFSQLFVGTRGGEVYAFHDSVDGVETPGESWRQKVGLAVRTLLPIGEGVLVHTFGGPLRLLGDGAHAGTTHWTIDAKLANSAPVSANYTLFTAGYEKLAAFRDYDGNPNWKLDGRFDSTGPVAAGDTLYVSEGTTVHAFALGGGIGAAGVRFGAKRWSHPTPAGAVEGLAVADGALFAACEGSKESDVTLYCLESA